ncbi:MTP-1 family protein [Guptibacillus hwajinpoensis]|uniref:MTP-1 family protein n=1 Tax=Guptibacillus hwajinpoensis TaxID=208199 RepID=UPI003735E9A4
MFTVQSLLDDYQKRTTLEGAEKLIFTGIGDRDVYNITAPFDDNGEWIIAGRVEARDTEHSEVVFFVEKNNVWTPKEDLRAYQLQDPFLCFIHGQLVFGGVEIFPHPENHNALSWRTVFYKGDNLSKMERFTTGPDGMKDIRLIELTNGTIGVFTRPQGEKGGRGKIGFTAIDNLDELQSEAIANASLIQEHFVEDEWGGANEVHLLANGEIGILGHIARFDHEGSRHYYPITCHYDPTLNRITNMEIIATRDDFPEGPAKRPDLQDVLFSGGLIRKENGQAVLYVGVSDAEAHRVTLTDPFAKYEKDRMIN